MTSLARTHARREKDSVLTGRVPWRRGRPGVGPVSGGWLASERHLSDIRVGFELLQGEAAKKRVLTSVVSTLEPREW